MENRQNCAHETLMFGSGDYYILCTNTKCGPRWAAVSPKQPEYGFAGQQPIGACAEIANQGVGATLSGKMRTNNPQHTNFCVDLPDGDKRKLTIWWAGLQNDGKWHISVTVSE